VNIAIIPARGGSRRIPGKNARLFHGKPIIAYSIETARASRCFSKVIVSTDSPEIAGIARAYGAKIHNRARWLAQDHVGTQEVMRQALIWWQASARGELPEYACCIYATAPLMVPMDLQAGLEMLRHSRQPYVFSVSADLAGARGPEHSHAPPGYLDVGQWYWGRPKAFVDRMPLEGNSKHYELPPARVCDINTEEDWQRAERLYGQLYPQVESQPQGGGA